MAATSSNHGTTPCAPPRPVTAVAARTVRAWVLALFALGTLAACLSAPPAPDPSPDPDPTPEPTPPTDPAITYVVTLTPAETVVLAGLSVRLTAQVEPPFDGDLAWEASGGALDPDGPAATFTAPGTAGTYRVSVAVPGDPTSGAFVDLVVPGGLDGAFSIAVIPDTQNMVKYAQRAPMVVAMTRWIVDHRDERGIAFVTHVGDVVEHADSEIEWTRARAALDLLDGVVPYAVAAGDHEYLPEEDKGGSVEAYSEHFGPHRYVGYDWYLGAHADGLSHAQLFHAGGRDFLHLAVEWEPTGSADDPTSPLGWARSVLEAHPSLPTILTTHAYLWDEPGREGHVPDAEREGFVRVDGVKNYVGAGGETLFATLVAPFPQVFMVLNGHYHRADLPSKGKFHQVSLNHAGAPVYEMLSNFQTWPNGGDGWMRLLEFLAGGGADGLDRIVATTYSPAREARGEDAYQTDPLGSFYFDLDFGERFASSSSLETIGR